MRFSQQQHTQKWVPLLITSSWRELETFKANETPHLQVNPINTSKFLCLEMRLQRICLKVLLKVTTLIKYCATKSDNVDSPSDFCHLYQTWILKPGRCHKHLALELRLGSVESLLLLLHTEIKCNLKGNRVVVLNGNGAAAYILHFCDIRAVNKFSHIVTLPVQNWF